MLFSTCPVLLAAMSATTWALGAASEPAEWHLRPAAAQQDREKLPSMVYPSNRQSTNWVETENGTRVAVDDGIEYEGMKIYLSLTWTLVAVDTQTQSTAWSRSVSAYWNQIGVEKITPTGEDAKTVVALRAARGDGHDFVEYYELKSGEPVTLPALQEAAGQKLRLSHVWSGNQSHKAEPVLELLQTEEQWRALHAEMFDGLQEAPPAEGAFDPNKEVLLVISSGDSHNCSGIGADSAMEDDERILLRLHYRMYQSLGDTPTVRPYGVFALPKRAEKPYLLQRNSQRYIGGPPIWTDYKLLGEK